MKRVLGNQTQARGGLRYPVVRDSLHPRMQE